MGTLINIYQLENLTHNRHILYVLTRASVVVLTVVLEPDVVVNRCKYCGFIVYGPNASNFLLRSIKEEDANINDKRSFLFNYSWTSLVLYVVNIITYVITESDFLGIKRAEDKKYKTDK